MQISVRRMMKNREIPVIPVITGVKVVMEQLQADCGTVRWFRTNNGT